MFIYFLMELNCSGVLSFAEGLGWWFPEEMERLPFDFRRMKHSGMFQDWDMDRREWKREENKNKVSPRGSLRGEAEGLHYIPTQVRR